MIVFTRAQHGPLQRPAFEAGEDRDGAEDDGLTLAVLDRFHQVVQVPSPGTSSLTAVLSDRVRRLREELGMIQADLS